MYWNRKMNRNGARRNWRRPSRWRRYGFRRQSRFSKLGVFQQNQDYGLTPTSTAEIHHNGAENVALHFPLSFRHAAIESVRCSRASPPMP